MTKRFFETFKAFAKRQPLTLSLSAFALGVITALTSVWMLDHRDGAAHNGGIVVLKPAHAGPADRMGDPGSWQTIFGLAEPQLSKTAVLLEGVNGETVAMNVGTGLAKTINDASPETVSMITAPRDLKVGDILNLRFGNGVRMTFRVMARTAADCASIDASVHPVPDVTLVKCDQAEQGAKAFWHYTVEAVDAATPQHQAVQHSL
jgi:hypothetical protein